MPPPVPTGKKTNSPQKPPIPQLTSSSHSRVCDCKKNKQTKELLNKDVKQGGQKVVFSSEFKPKHSPKLRMKMSSSEQSLSTLKSPSQIENQKNMDLIRASTKAKLVFMQQKLTTQRLLNKSENMLHQPKPNAIPAVSPKGSPYLNNFKNFK